VKRDARHGRKDRRGIGEADPQVTLKLYNLAKSDRNDVMTEIFRSRAVIGLELAC
jgi:hypothetical protein